MVAGLTKASAGRGPLTGATDWEFFESVTQAGKIAVLATFATPQAARALLPIEGAYRQRLARVVRDYGMHDRGQAPES